jgi:hypothetical protein
MISRVIAVKIVSILNRAVRMSPEEYLTTQSRLREPYLHNNQSRASELRGVIYLLT